MKPVEIRGLKIGEGIPKICVSLIGSSAEELKFEAENVVLAGADLAEWRVDWFSAWNDAEQLTKALEQIRQGLGTLPLLVTFRTKQEGGNSVISVKQYRDLYQTILARGQADLIDLELYFNEPMICELIGQAHDCGVKTVLSNHDFQKTPDREELVKRMIKMEEIGADIGKIAVMPLSGTDVASLLQATAEASEQLSCPIITMAMGGKGVISRMAGQIFGSTVTFAALGKGSAPGQIPLNQLKEVLTLVDSLQ